MTRTRLTARSDASSTTRTDPSAAARRAFRLGIPPPSTKHRPATVEAPAGSSSSVPSSRLTSRIGVSPRTTAVPSGSRVSGGTLVVVLAEDVAHQLLDQILERHHPRHDAVFVHGDRDALALALHEAQHLDRRDRLRKKLHAAQQVLQHDRPAVPGQRHDVLRADVAEDLVQRMIVDGDARAPLLEQEAADLIHRRVDRQRVDARRAAT